MRYGCLWIWMLRSAALVFFYSSFSAHNTSFKNTALKKNKKKTTDMSRDQNTICVWTQYSNSCSSSTVRFVYGPTNTWMGHICFYLFIFTLRYVIAPFPYLSRPLISAALAPALLLQQMSGDPGPWLCVCSFRESAFGPLTDVHE